jgi:hypothetical protein
MLPEIVEPHRSSTYAAWQRLSLKGPLIAAALLLGATLITSNHAEAKRLIPNEQCAVIVMASKDTQLVLDSLRNYQAIAPSPLAIESNNGFFAASLGIFSRSEGASFIKTQLAAGRLPKDAYCGNTERYVRTIYPNQDFSALVDQPVKVASESTPTVPVTLTVAQPAAQVTKTNSADSAQASTNETTTSPTPQAKQSSVQMASNANNSGQPVVQASVAPAANPSPIPPASVAINALDATDSPSPASSAAATQKSSLPKLSKPTIGERRAQGEEISLEEEAVFFVAGGFIELMQERVSVDGCKTSTDLYTHDLMPQLLLQLNKEYRKEAAVLRLTNDYNKANWKSLRFEVFLNGSGHYNLDCAVDCREFVVYEDIRTKMDQSNAVSLKTIAGLSLNKRIISVSFTSGVKTRLEKALAVVQKTCPGVTTRF